MIRQAALGVKFALELCLLAALTTWGFETSSSVVAKVVLGVGAPLAAAGHAALALIFALAVVLDTAVLVATGEADA